jgi:hypothetical protein
VQGLDTPFTLSTCWEGKSMSFEKSSVSASLRSEASSSYANVDGGECRMAMMLKRSSGACLN